MMVKRSLFTSVTQMAKEGQQRILPAIQQFKMQAWLFIWRVTLANFSDKLLRMSRLPQTGSQLIVPDLRWIQKTNWSMQSKYSKGNARNPGHSAPYTSIFIDTCRLVKFLESKISFKEQNWFPSDFSVRSPRQVAWKWFSPEFVVHYGALLLVQSYWQLGISAAVETSHPKTSLPSTPRLMRASEWFRKLPQRRQPPSYLSPYLCNLQSVFWVRKIVTLQGLNKESISCQYLAQSDKETAVRLNFWPGSRMPKVRQGKVSGIWTSCSLVGRWRTLSLNQNSLGTGINSAVIGVLLIVL